jgi:uncharacterized protein (DUF58 family)
MVPIPTRRLALVAAAVSGVIVIADLRTVLGLVLANVVLLVVAGVDAWAAPAPASITVERTMPGTLTLGTDGEVRWRLHNPHGRRVRVSMSDELAPSLQAEDRRVEGWLPARATWTAATTIRPGRRGRFELHEVVVRVNGPLGLAARQGRRDLPGRLRVMPRFRSAKEAQLRTRQARILESGLRVAAGRGGGTEFDSLREYTVDDEPRRIDWAATARSGKPIVRTYRPERNQTILILLDTGRGMAGQVDGVPRLEHAMDAALMLTVVATGIGDRVGLVAFDREVRVIGPPGHGSGQLGRLTNALYDLELRLVESDYRGAFAETLARYRRRTLLVVLTELTEEAVGEVLLPALPLLAGRHLVLLGSVLDPEVGRWDSAVPTEAETAYRKAAATTALTRRYLTVASLRSVGVTVIDAPPSAFPSRLTDAYLEVKAVGRL